METREKCKKKKNFAFSHVKPLSWNLIKLKHRILDSNEISLENFRDES